MEGSRDSAGDAMATSVELSGSAQEPWLQQRLEELRKKVRWGASREWDDFADWCFENFQSEPQDGMKLITLAMIEKCMSSYGLGLAIGATRVR